MYPTPDDTRACVQAIVRSEAYVKAGTLAERLHPGPRHAWI